MFVGSVVKHHVEHQADSHAVSFTDEGFAVLHSAEHGINSPVVRDIIAVINHRRAEKRSYPYVVDTKRFYVAEL